MRYLSVCSGVEAASLAWEPLGWAPQYFSEIEPAPCAVLAHRWPAVPNLGDMTKYKEWPDAAIDVLVGGTPCQSFSVAGLRKGLDDPRGNLMLTYLAIADRYRPHWLVWENVPGVLSSNGGRDFGTFLGALAELGYGFAYRVLDAQHFGVPQRRRRVFVVGHLGDWRHPAAVLFERHSLSGHSPPSREAREVSAAIPSRRTGGGGLGSNFDCGGGLIPSIAGTMKACKTSGGWSNSVDHAAAGYMIACPHISPSLKARDYKGPSSDGDGDGAPLIAHTLRGEGDPMFTLQRGAQNGVAIAFDCKAGGNTGFAVGCTAGALRGDGHGGGHAAIRTGSAVRRLTPRECERLMGFPDDFTLVPHRGKPMADGPRYKMIGNSIATPVVKWIGERIAMVSGLAPKPPDQGAAL